MTGEVRAEALTRVRDGKAWRIGTAAEVDWITERTRTGLTIASGIPPVFAAYATIVLPDPEDGLDPPERETEWTQYMLDWGRTARAQHERALLDVLADQSPGAAWWLGYLDTGAANVVFPDAPLVPVYHSSWRYVLVAAGPEQAARWRERDWKLAIPDLIFPADHSWLVSTLWDDDWTCVGGPAELIDRFLHDPVLETRPVALGQDATPPGHPR